MSKTNYAALSDAMRQIHSEIAKGEPRYALVSRMGGEFKWEQVAGRQYDMERIKAAVARRLGFA